MTVYDTDLTPSSDVGEDKTSSPKPTANSGPSDSERAQFFDPEGFPAIHRSLTRLSESLRSERNHTYVDNLSDNSR